MNSEITPGDIDKFFNNQLNPEESECVADYLKNMSDQDLSAYLSDEAFLSTQPVEIPATVRTSMRMAVKREVKGYNHKWKRQLLVAASIMGALWVGYYFLQRNEYERSYYIGNLSVGIHKINVSNNTTAEKYIHLPDGSEVLMTPGSSLNYYSNFLKNRFVYMDGNARFSVRHDPAHPFNVVANGIGTLDIGTSFWVESNKNAATVTIKLLEGSIVVKSLENNLPNKNVYLQPGQQICIRKEEGNYLVSNIKSRPPEFIGTHATPSLSNTTTTWTNESYTFSKASMESVFDKLSARYHIKIQLDPDVTAGPQFTGRFMYNDSLDVLLDAICRVTHLSYAKQGDSVRIYRK